MADHPGQRKYNYGFLLEEEAGDTVRLTVWSSRHGLLPLISVRVPKQVISAAEAEGEPVEVLGQSVQISKVRFAEGGPVPLEEIFDQLAIRHIDALEETPEHRERLAPDPIQPAREWCGWNWPTVIE